MEPATALEATDQSSGERLRGTVRPLALDAGPGALGDWYLARYEPISLGGAVVGMVFVGDC